MNKQHTGVAIYGSSLVVRALDLLQLMAMSSNPCNMAIFQFFSMAAAAIVDFQIFNGWNVQEGQTASLCQISLKSAKTRPRYHDLSIFQDGSAAILNFKNFKFLTVEAV